MNMDKDAGTVFAAQPVEKFLEKIARERDAAIGRIRAGARETGAALRRQARQESHRLLRAAATHARTHARLERQRLISEVQARLRRRQWQELQGWVQTGVESVMEELHARWADRDRQWEWAEYWLRAALERAGNQDLQVECGALTNEMTMHRMEKFLSARAARLELRHSPEIGCGLRIAWGPYLLDGTLDAQRAAIEKMLLARLARLCHEACA